MFYHLNQSLRNLRRNGFYSAVNIIGLSVSLTAVIFIFWWVGDELSVDRYHKQAADTYVVFEHETYYGTSSYSEYMPLALSDVAKNEIPEVKEACSVGKDWQTLFLEYKGEKYFKNTILLADTSLFRIFDYTFLEGNPQRAFLDNSSIVLSQKLAKKMFGDEPAYGKMVISVEGAKSNIRNVSAVVSIPPKQSFIDFDALLPVAARPNRIRWDAWSSHCFLLLHPNADITQVGQKLTKAHRSNAGWSDDEEPLWEPHVLFPLTKYHLYNMDGSGGRIVAVRLFILTGLILLLMACVNYVNLVTARAIKRRGEMAIRKAIGAIKWRLFKQLMSEALLLFGIASCTAILLVNLCLPLYVMITGSSLSPSLSDPYLWLLLLLAFIAMSLLAGLYPALMISSFKPMGVFQALPSKQTGHLSLRSLLVIFQFACSAAFILAMLVLWIQFRYMQHKDLGYRTGDIFTIDFDNNQHIGNHIDSFLSDLNRESTIAGATVSSQHIMDVGNCTDGFEWEGMAPGSVATTFYMEVNSDFPKVMGLEFVAGSGFTGTPADSSRILLNETAVKRMNIQDPLGKRFVFWGREYRIAGIVKDFHFKHLKESIEPCALFISKNIWTLYVKAKTGQRDDALAAVEKVWRQYDKEAPFDFRFMEDTFAYTHREDKQMTTLFNLFAFLAALISCLGLFGLVTFTIETRTKEIGIRKVLGATISNMMTMLTKEFLILAGIGMAIAFPIAYYLLNRLLQDYAYRISISWWMFALAGAITLSLTLFTVSWQAIKAATANPVKSIKTE